MINPALSVSEISHLIVQILTLCVFEPSFGRLRDDVRCSSWAHWKARSRLPISVNWSFFSAEALADSFHRKWWRRGVAVERRIRDREVAGSSLSRARRKNSGQVSHTYG